ncbi:MAG: MMPL family transporter [Deltaproteobacteria bacterium]|nr:MAG: MMPL family transporter [Deltaproteobacteria bacterium]
MPHSVNFKALDLERGKCGMAKDYGQYVGSSLAWWVKLVHRSSAWIVVLATMATGVSLYYTVNHLGINTDTAEMLSEELPFRRNYNEFKEAFPQFDDAMLIVIDGETPDLAYDASIALAAGLKRRSDLFVTVYLPGGSKFFQRHGLLYLGPVELDELADNLARIQPFLGKLTRDRSLRGFFSMLTSAVNAVMDGEELDLTAVFERVHQAIAATVQKQHYALSWQELMLGGESTADGLRRFIMTQPRLDYSKLFPAETAIKTVRALTAELNLTEAHGVRVRLTGDAALEYEELLSVTRGAGIAGILALASVGVVLFVGLRSPRLVTATLLTLIMGLVWTAWFASVAVGHLNLISVAFAVLYIGLSVDYALHFCLRYRELIQQGESHGDALQQTAGDIGGSLVICSFTTAIGFYAFIPTAFAGVAELGLISGTGMFISLFANLTVLPALLSLMPLRLEPLLSGQKPSRFVAALSSLLSRRSRAIRTGALVSGIGAVLLLPHVSFDSNPMNLRDPESESVATFIDLLAQRETSPWTLTVLAEDDKFATGYADRLTDLDLVDKCVVLDYFLPANQDEKLSKIEEIALIVGPELTTTSQEPPPNTSEQLAALYDFSATLESYIKSTNNTNVTVPTQRLSDSLKRFNATLGALDRASQSQLLMKLQTSLLGSLSSQLRALNALLEADKVTQSDLPVDLVERWRSRDGRYRIEVFPRENLSDGETLRRFIAAVRTVAPNATGFPIIYVEAGDAVVRAFQQALALALAAIVALLVILMHSRRDVLLVILPLLLAGALTGAASVLLRIPFNFANVIALPLLLGIGVDSGIHMVHRLRTAPPSDGHILQTSTARAVFFSSLTTIASFGNLAISAHRGMASMGELLTLGIGFTVLCTLVILPALADLGNRRSVVPVVVRP